ncbi:uncharacterized protein LOC118194046 [Stegodyphus dumicola]|uniref:uncharacterized protein LOC118194046 n=1 Tax=Stegodyphus dumicola TaxID=202533 RepID=UPI0015AB25D7|nr:uncharacterized protein LOC118194046 [Stegodyphus dumicola]
MKRKKMQNTLVEQNTGAQPLPEETHFRSCMVIGNLPNFFNFGKFFTLFSDIIYWKNMRKIIPDIFNPQKKAVIFVYDNEEVTQLCAFKVKRLVSRLNFTLYDGAALFYQCMQLEKECDFRSRSVLVSGIDCNIPRDMYFELFRAFGTICYSEFCIEGEIPKIRIEYTRATSALAAMLRLQGALPNDALITIEIPLFPISPVGNISRSDSLMQEDQIELAGNSNISLPVLPSTNEFQQKYFMIYTMNYIQTNEPCFEKFPALNEIGNFPRGEIQNYLPNEISSEISLNRMKENRNSLLSTHRMFGSFDKSKEDVFWKFLALCQENNKL